MFIFIYTKQIQYGKFKSVCYNYEKRIIILYISIFYINVVVIKLMHTIPSTEYYMDEALCLQII